MYTLGAIALTFLCGLLFEVAFGLVGSFLNRAIYSTTGITFLPIMISAALTGCAAYGSLFYALKVIPQSNIAVTFWAILVLWSLAMIGNVLSHINADAAVIGTDLILQVFAYGAAILGNVLAAGHIRAERAIGDTD